ncbi:MAG: hypothetical protein H6Q25_932 [Bacteroidetes bacterium]|nr:hypothetical protein [Bacteroidota bacterium]
MKNRFIVMMILLITVAHLNGQNLISLYKNGNIKLVEETNYGSKNDWNSLLFDYNLEQYGKETGKMKRIVVAPDGSIFMSHKSKYEIWKFDKNGNFVLKFGKKGSGKDQFPFLPTVEGIMDGKYIFTSDCQGRIKFFDLNGKFVKMIQLKYMPLEIIPLANSKLAILGYTNNKSIVVIKDFNTETEKRILTENSSSIEGSMSIELPGGNKMYFQPPYSQTSSEKICIATAKNGNLLVALTSTGVVTEYSKDGKKIQEFNLNIPPLKITEEDINDYYQTTIKGWTKFEENLMKMKKYSKDELEKIKKQYNSAALSFKEKKNYPDHLPFFTSLIVDSEGNLIVFEYTKTDQSNKFRAYTFDPKGKFVCTSSFQSDTYELNFEPNSMAFYQGFIYGVVFKKQCKDKCLRLMKFKMTISH